MLKNRIPIIEYRYAGDYQDNEGYIPVARQENIEDRECAILSKLTTISYIVNHAAMFADCEESIIIDLEKAHKSIKEIIFALGGQLNESKG